MFVNYKVYIPLFVIHSAKFLTLNFLSGIYSSQLIFLSFLFSLSISFSFSLYDAQYFIKCYFIYSNALMFLYNNHTNLNTKVAKCMEI